MPAINDPEAVRFQTDIVRSMCEEARAFLAKVAAAKTKWFGGINAKFPNDSSIVDDGRQDEGVSELTGADVNSVMGILIAMETASNSEIISKPCVRALRAD